MSYLVTCMLLDGLFKIIKVDIVTCMHAVNVVQHFHASPYITQVKSHAEISQVNSFRGVLLPLPLSLAQRLEA